MKAVNDMLKESEKQNQIKLETLASDLECSKQECQNYKVALESAQKKCEYLEQEISQLNAWKKQTDPANKKDLPVTGNITQKFK